MSKNLTGSKRIIFDSCVDLYNAVQKWRSLTADCHSGILNIWRVKQEEVLNTKSVNEEQLNISQDSYLQLEKLSSTFLAKLENLETTLKKLQSTLVKVKAVSELSDLHHSKSSELSSATEHIPFKAWSLDKFSIVVEEIVTMFEKEFQVKSAICQEICHISNKSVFLVLEICWKYEPYVDKYTLKSLLDSIIYELDLTSEL